MRIRDRHTIDLESVNRAIRLTEYFRTTAVKVQTAVSQEQLSELHRNIYLNLPQRFTTAEGDVYKRQIESCL